MRPTPFETLCLFLILVAVGGHLVLGDDRTQRNFEVFPDMVDGPAYESQDPCPAFVDGQTLRTPPAGTVGRGFLPLRASDGSGLDPTTAWEKLDEPARAAWDAISDTTPAPDQAAHAARRARGAVVYENFCAVCHGPGGLGDGPAAKRGVPPPPSFLRPETRALSDGRMYRIVTHGQGNMAAYASQISREDRWNVILHIRALQEAQ